MCGIFGAVGPAAEPLAVRAVGCLRHRGPDGEGVAFFAATSTALSHTRLAILDLGPSASQPITDSHGMATLVFNGEIYNYRELRAELEGAYQFRSTGDTEVVLAAYLRWGEAMLPRLNGIFALALHDHRDRSLLLARDALGVKPLYLARSPGHFAFASELKALLALPGLDRTLDPQALANYVTYLYGPGEATPFRSVKKLRPGRFMRLIEGEVEREGSFVLRPFDQPELPLTEAGAVKELRRRMDVAVRRQMVSDVPVGAFLSGGLDSSAICAYAARIQTGAPLDCFTLRSPGASGSSEGFESDLPYAQEVARTIGANLHMVDVSSDEMLDLDRLVWELDEPQADPAALITQTICAHARRQGIKVLLSGVGGDDVFAGYRRHAALRIERLWRWLPRSARAALRLASRGLPLQPAWGRRIRKGLSRADRDSPERIIGYHQWIEPEVLKTLWSDEFRRCGPIPEPDVAFADSLADAPHETSDLNRMLLLERNHFLCDHNLNYADKMSMSQGVEVRIPFLDPDLLALADRLPSDFKQRGSTGKWILRRAMEGVIPASVINRSKTGFGIPVRHLVGRGDGRVLSDYLSQESVRRRGIFEPSAVARLASENAAGRVDASYVLLAMAAVEAWCRRFADKPVSL